ncbi:MAG: hypothetical protein J4428_03780 [Candidatus Aenigmarchaeota archaeon]|nr:hypothetical protein [Candidatus Aenigmarchaeota archaeon]
MSLKKIVISGLVAGLVSFFVGSALYMNPFVSEIYAKYSDWPGLRPMSSFGGLGNWLLLMLFGGLFSTVLLAFLYSYTERGIGLKPVWQKGLFFGVLYWLVSRLPGAYYMWLMYTYPNILNIVELFNGLIGSMVAGLVLAILYKKLK